MLQSFTAATTPETGPARLAALRAALAREDLDGFLVPRADAHQGEYVADADQRLSWLTGFTGSAGFCVALRESAGVFVDGRYRVQVRNQVDTDHFTPVDWPENRLADWLRQQLPDGGRVGFDPWLHTRGEIDQAEEGLRGSGITLCPVDNLVDRVWKDRPAPPAGAMVPYPLELAGRDSAEKRAQIAGELTDAGHVALAVTQPDAIAWLLNTRGSDLGQTPVTLAFAILHDSGRVDLFIDPAKTGDGLRAHLGNSVTLCPPESFGPALSQLEGAVLIDRGTAPVWVEERVRAGAGEVVFGADPIALAKARKNDREIAGTRNAHIRDGAAVAEFLAWFDAQDAVIETLSEIDMVKKLEACRRASGELVNISFDTIAGTGPHGAIMHYRVTEETNRRLARGDLMVLDSGGQYRDGTTDITRTLPVGTPGQEEKRAFTLVLKGMIALSRLRFPVGAAGRDLDALARYHLWLDGKDFDHGTGHGVGVFLGVHEGPQRLSRVSSVPLDPGMILSNEPGYYREGAFGIRIENLIVTRKGAVPFGGDERKWLEFETLTFAPIHRALIDVALLEPGERAWLDGYHAEVLDKIGPLVTEPTRRWLERACAPL